MIAYQLFRPFAYLSINHPSKKIVDVTIPVVLMFCSLTVLFLGRGALNVWGTGGLVTLIQAVVQALPGFYIAALAAVATFGRQTSLDALIPEPTPTIETWYGTDKVEIELTRRRFLCLLFAHLTALSLALSMFAAFALSIAPLVRNALPGWFGEVLFYVFSAAYFFFVFQMLIVTLWGLFYLSDKMHQPDTVVIPEKDVQVDNMD